MGLSLGGQLSVDWEPVSDHGLNKGNIDPPPSISKKSSGTQPEGNDHHGNNHNRSSLQGNITSLHAWQNTALDKRGGARLTASSTYCRKGTVC